MRLYPITVDNQEKLPAAQVRVDELLRLGVSAKLGHLEVGDYRFLIEYDENTFVSVVIERKSLRDLVASVADGRLNRFIDHTEGVPNLYRCLLIEGLHSDDKDWDDDK